MSTTLILLVQAFVILVVPPTLHKLSGAQRLLPLVVVQILVGVALGPSILGRLSPHVFATFATPDSLRALSAVASLAVLLFGLITGLHLGSDLVVEPDRIFPMVLVARFVVPTLLGFAAGLWIVSRYGVELLPGIHPAVFALAFGIACGMTALPVLGMILGELHLLDSRFGKIALGVAGVTDTILWVLIGMLLTAKMNGSATSWGRLLTPALMITYLIVMWAVLKPTMAWFLSRRVQDGMISEGGLLIVVAFTIMSATVVELIGMDFMIGACLAGVVLPPQAKQPILDRLHFVTTMFLMPFFFVLTGLRTFIDVSHTVFWEALAASMLAAGVGAFVSVAVVAWWAGASWRQSTILGGLLQAKGMMEVIVLSIFLKAGIISSNIFAALVMMGVGCTMLTLPLVRLASGGARRIDDLGAGRLDAPGMAAAAQEAT